MKNVLSRTLFTSLILTISLIFNIVQAADEKPDSMADVWILTPNAGQVAEFEAAIKKHTKYRQEKGEPRSWKFFVPITGNKMNQYVIRYCCTKFNDMDAYLAWDVKNNVSKHFGDTVGQYVAHSAHFYADLDFENSNWPAENPGFKYFGVTTYYPKVGKGKDIESAKKAMSDAAKAMKWPYNWSWQWGWGEKSNLQLVSPFTNYADMTEPEKSFGMALAEHLGKDKAEDILENWVDNFQSIQYVIYREREDLSMPDK